MISKKDIQDLGFIYNYKADLDNRMDTPEHSCNAWQCIMLDIPFCNSSRDVDFKLTYLGTENNPNIYRIEMYERNHFEWYPVFEGKLKNIEALVDILNVLSPEGVEYLKNEFRTLGKPITV